MRIMKIFFKFIYLFWEREREQERGRERRERIPSRLYIVSAEPDVGLQLGNLEVMTWAEIKSQMLGEPGWLSRLSVRLWLRSWSLGLWVQAPRWALCWQLRAWSLLQSPCLPLALPLPCLRSVSLCLSKINKTFKKLNVYSYVIKLLIKIPMFSLWITIFIQNCQFSCSTHPFHYFSLRWWKF